MIHQLVFIGMDKLDKHIRIRLTTEQFRRLADVLITEQRTKSSLMRDILSDYLDGNKRGIYKQTLKKNKNQKTL